MLQGRDEAGDEGGGEAEEHADQGAFDVEPLVVVGGRHVFGAGDDEALVVAEPKAIQHEGVEPVHHHPERVGGQSVRLLLMI